MYGPERGDLLILGWGSTHGSIRSAVERLQADGRSVAHAHLRHLNPFPRNLGEILGNYRHVLIPEINLGQLALLVRGRYLVDAIPYDRVRGKPFRIAEIVEAAEAALKGEGISCTSATAPATSGRPATEPGTAAATGRPADRHSARRTRRSSSS